MGKPLKPHQIEILDNEVVAALRVLTPVQKLAMAFECNRIARLRLQEHFRSLHPDWSDTQVLAEVARRMLEEATD